MTLEWDAWVEKCATLLKSNQIESKGYRYTRPAPMTYEQQWLWDSCFHAITYRWFDTAMAQDELLSLVVEQVKTGDDAGMIPHMTYWQGGGTELWGQDAHTIITQPPLIAIAAELVFQRTQDIALLQKLYQPLCDYHAWFVRRRDPDSDHLVTLIHPWECGCDASPRWDIPLGLTNPTPEETRAKRHGLVKDLLEYNCDAKALGEAGFFHVEALDFNAIRAADLEALGRIAALLDKPEDAQRWLSHAETVQQRIMKQIAESGTFWDLNGLDEKPLAIDTNAKFILLFGGCVTQEMAQTLVADLESPRYWTNYPVTTTPTDVPTYSPDHYWRGNVWLSVNWLIYQGLRRYGYTQQASVIAERSLALVEQYGFHEYFNPETGQGHGPALQSWSAIILDMLATEQGRM